MKRITWIGFVAVSFVIAGASRAADIGTAFTYQGSLEKGSGPVTDTCDFRFGLWDAAAGGNQVGTSPQTAALVDVADGVFTVTLDFGAGAIDGKARWLAIEVKCPADADFVMLAPRVALTPAPHALALRHLRTEPASSTSFNTIAPNVIGGYSGNFVLPDVAAATVFGGGVTSGGSGILENSAGATFATVSGGISNQANGLGSTVGGGNGNAPAGTWSTVGGGQGNRPNGYLSTVAGGGNNNPSGYASTVPGGRDNDANGDYSLAAGRRAKVRDPVAAGEDPETCATGTCGDEGTFIWADSTNVDFTSTGPNQFLIRASGGVGIGTTTPPSQLSIYEDGDNADQNVFTQDNANAGVNIITDYVNGNYTPGVFWSTVNNNADKPKAGIYLRETNLGTEMRFGTSNNFGIGITNDAMIIDPSGNVGIKRTPTTNDLEVEGDASKTAAGGWLGNSDAAIKTGVRTISGALEVIDRLRPIAFRYTDDYKAKHPSVREQDYYNYIAQEFREVFPDSVQDSGEDGLLQMDAYPASVYAVAAIQELHQLVQEKDCEIEDLKTRLARFEALLDSSGRDAKGERP